MKKILFLMLAAVLFAACSSDDDNDNGGKNVIDFADYSTTVGMTYKDFMNKFGEPAMAFDGFYSYEINDGKTEALTLMTNAENSKVYAVMQILAEDAYKFEDIYAYFASKYTMYEYREAGMVEEDGEEYETEATATFGNAEKEEDATLVIVVSGSGSVSYVDPTNQPAEPEPGTLTFAGVAPQDAAAMFLGRNWEDVKDEYGDAIINYGGMNMIMVEDNDYYTCLYFEIVDGIVDKVQILFDDFEDDDAAAMAYFESLGYTVMDCGEEDGVHMYLCMNMTTNDMFTYSACIATFVYADPDAEDEGEDED